MMGLTDKMVRVEETGRFSDTACKGGGANAIHMDVSRWPVHLYAYAGREEQRKPPLGQVTVFGLLLDFPINLG